MSEQAKETEPKDDPRWERLGPRTKMVGLLLSPGVYVTPKLDPLTRSQLLYALRQDQK